MYRKALAINPSHPQSWTNLGIAHAMMGDTAGALEPFRRGCEADPTNGDAWVNLARCYKALGDESGAADALATHCTTAGRSSGGAGSVSERCPKEVSGVENP